jgi:hypothetical protein
MLSNIRHHYFSIFVINNYRKHDWKELQDYLTTNYPWKWKVWVEEFKSLEVLFQEDQVTMLFLMFLQLQTCKAVI